jgi:hypothetical protein
MHFLSHTAVSGGGNSDGRLRCVPAFTILVRQAIERQQRFQDPRCKHVFQRPAGSTPQCRHQLPARRRWCDIMVLAPKTRLRSARQAHRRPVRACPATLLIAPHKSGYGVPAVAAGWDRINPGDDHVWTDRPDLDANCLMPLLIKTLPRIPVRILNSGHNDCTSAFFRKSQRGRPADTLATAGSEDSFSRDLRRGQLSSRRLG